MRLPLQPDALRRLAEKTLYEPDAPTSAVDSSPPAVNHCYFGSGFTSMSL